MTNKEAIDDLKFIAETNILENLHMNNEALYLAIMSLEEKHQVDCENCDFRKFTETFVDGVVDVMNKNGITSVEQLSEILKGGAEK